MNVTGPAGAARASCVGPDSSKVGAASAAAELMWVTQAFTLVLP